MLENFAVPQIAHMQPRIIFQQDGAPPHWDRNVQQFLNDKFPGHWIGHGGPTPWPPCSPDITPLDFSLWGYLKDRVYITRVNDLLDLKQPIRDVINSVTEDMPFNTWRLIDYRLNILRSTRGAHVQVY